MNGYAYSGNNPATFSDPDGLSPIPGIRCITNPVSCGFKWPGLKERITSLPTQIVGMIEGMLQSAIDGGYGAANASGKPPTT